MDKIVNTQTKKQAVIVFNLLPRNAKRIIIANPEKQQKVSRVVKEIFRRHGKDISALANS